MPYSKKNNKPKAPHIPNNFFKQSLSQIQVAEDLFHNLLPKDILAMVALTTLKPKKDIFIDNNIGERKTDDLFSVNFGEGGFSLPPCRTPVDCNTWPSE